MTLLPSLVVLLATVAHLADAQQTVLYGTVAYRTTRLRGTVQSATTARPDYYRTPDPYTYAPYSYQYGYTSAPEQFDRRGYGSGSASASSSQSQSGRGVSVGGSASSSGSSQQMLGVGGAGQRRPVDSRYSGQAAASGYGGRQPAAYDPYAQQRDRYPQQSEPRYREPGEFCSRVLFSSA